MQRFYLSTLGVLLALGLAVGGCRSQSDEVGETETETPAPEETTAATPTASPEPTATAAPETPETPAESGYTPIDPPQKAVLTARQADAQINLRSQPTTQSADKGYGLVGDPITLLRTTTGEGGLTWYYVRFASSGAEGWIRGDFVDTSGAARPDVTTGAPVGEGFEAEGACSGTLRTRYDSASYMMFICDLRDGGLRYIGRNKNTGDVVISDEVIAIENGYVAKKDGYEYHLSPSAIVVYQVSGGEPNRLAEESIQSVQPL